MIAQLTVPSDQESAKCTFGAQGRSVGYEHLEPDWEENCIEVLVGGSQNGYGTHVSDISEGVVATHVDRNPPPPPWPAQALPLPSCSTYDEFVAVFAPVNTKCCDEPTEDCSAGFPATCNEGCAAVLLPAQAACEDFLAGGGLAMAGTKHLIDRATALCPTNGGGH